jgi:hypothetical protein
MANREPYGPCRHGPGTVWSTLSPVAALEPVAPIRDIRSSLINDSLNAAVEANVKNVVNACACITPVQLTFGEQGDTGILPAVSWEPDENHNECNGNILDRKICHKLTADTRPARWLFCHLSAGHCASMDSLRTGNLDVRHPITAEVILNVFDKRLPVTSQPLGIVA